VNKINGLEGIIKRGTRGGKIMAFEMCEIPIKILYDSMAEVPL